jgi:hypothetical protein
MKEIPTPSRGASTPFRGASTPSRDAQFWTCAGLLLAVGLFLRLQGLGRGLWLDEYQSCQFAGLEGFRRGLALLRNDIHPPAYYLILGLWQRLGAVTEASLRSLTVAISMAWMALALVWLKSYRRSAALIAGLLFATQPFLVRYGQEIRDYALMLLFMVAAFYFTSAFVRNTGDRRQAGLAGLAVVFAVGTHLIAVFLPAAMLAFALAAAFVSPEKITAGRAPASVGTGLVDRVRGLVPLAISVIPIPAAEAFLLLRYFFAQPRDLVAWIPPTSVQSLARTGSSLLQIATLPENWRPFALALLVASTGVALVFGSWRLSLPFFAAALAYSLEVLLGSLLHPMLVDRYLLPGVVLFIAWLGIQMATIHGDWQRRLAVFCMALLAAMFALNWTRSEATVPIEAWRELRDVLPREIDPGTQVFLQPDYSYPIFHHYVPDYPQEQIVKVPADHTTEPFLSHYEGGGFSHAMVVFRGMDVARVTPLCRALLAAVRRRSARPAVVEIYFVGPSEQEYFSTFLRLASATLGEQPRVSTDKAPISTARFELRGE